MKRLLVFVAVSSVAASGAALAQTPQHPTHPTHPTPRPSAPASSYTGSELAPQARVTLAEARAIALRARPGEITDQELEREGGGSGLRYSFDIHSQGKTYEVGVDARTGHVLENKIEGPNPD